MSATRVLEVVIALVFMFYATALICSGLVEWLSNLMKKRAKYLLRGLRAMLVRRTTEGGTGELDQLVTGKGAAKTERTLYQAAMGSDAAAARVEQLTAGAGDVYQRIVEHPLVRSLGQSTPDNNLTRYPSYLPARTFVAALLDVLDNRDNKADVAQTIDHVRAGVKALDDGDLKKSLTALLQSHGADLEKLREALEHWYDDQMDRLSGAYKRWAKRWVVVIGIVIAAVMHLDAIGLVKDLWTDAPARAAIVKATEAAEECPASPEEPQTTETPATDTTPAEGEPTDEEVAACIDEAVAVLAGAGPPIGPQAWGEGPESFGGWLLLLLGILLTGAASALGAPFWFDALGRLNSLRNSGPKPPKADG